MELANTARSKGPAARDVENPRFARLLRGLAADPRFAAVVDDFRASPRAGRKGFGSRTLNVGGKMFAMLAKGRLVVKLPRDRADALVASEAGEYFDPGHGRRMKQWVTIIDPRVSWLRLAKAAHDFVAGSKR